MANYFRNENFKISEAKKNRKLNINRKFLNAEKLILKSQSVFLYKILMNKNFRFLFFFISKFLKFSFRK